MGIKCSDATRTTYCFGSKILSLEDESLAQNVYFFSEGVGYHKNILQHLDEVIFEFSKYAALSCCNSLFA